MATQEPLKKNATAKIVFPIYDSSGDLLSGATGLDSEYSLDGGSFSDCASEAIEIGSTGIYYLELTADETNGDIVAIIVKTTSVTGKTSALVFYTSAQTLDEVYTSVGTRAPASEYDTEMARITADVATESKQDTAQTDITLIEQLLKNRLVVDVSGSQMILYADDGTTPLVTWALTDKDGNAIDVATGVPTRRGVPS